MINTNSSKEITEREENSALNGLKKWKEAAQRNPEWAERHPMQIEIGGDSKNKLTITVIPPLDETASIAEKAERSK